VPGYNNAFLGIGINSTTVPSGLGFAGSASNALFGGIAYRVILASGFNSCYPLQRAYTGTTATYYGTIDSQAIAFFQVRILA
jgi:hypothetical protein